MNKSTEFKILSKVFDTSRFIIEKSERPDFLLKYESPVSEKYFGVEIAELYSSESSARIHNVVGYFDELIDTGKYLHKDDVQKIPVRPVTLTSPEGVSYNLNGLIEYSKQTDIIESFYKIVVDKNKKLKKYNVNCIHHNLIINDQECMIINNKSNELLLTTDIVNSIRESQFREIYLATTIAGISGYLPLKLFIINIDIKAFIIAINKVLELNDYDGEDYLITFYGFLCEIGYKNVLVSKEEKSYKVILPRYEVSHPDSFAIRLQYECEKPSGEYAKYNKKLVSSIISEIDYNFRVSTKCFMDTNTERIRE